MFVWSDLLQNFYTNKPMFRLQKLIGFGFGNYNNPKKIQIFIWKSMFNRLPTRQYLAFSCPEINNRCPRCNTPETIIHILRDCHWAKMVWCHSPGIFAPILFSPSTSRLAPYQRYIEFSHLPLLATMENLLPLPLLALMVG